MWRFTYLLLFSHVKRGKQFPTKKEARKERDAMLEKGFICSNIKFYGEEKEDDSEA